MAGRTRNSPENGQDRGQGKNLAMSTLLGNLRSSTFYLRSSIFNLRFSIFYLISSIFYLLSSAGCTGPRPGTLTVSPSLLSPPAPAVQARSQAPESAPVRPASLSTPKPASSLPDVGETAARVMARVNGQPILREEVEAAALPSLLEAQAKVPPSQWPEVRTKILHAELESIIQREIILQDANSRIRPQNMEKIKGIAAKECDEHLRKQKTRLNLKSDDELRAFYERQHLNLEEYRRQFERSFIATEYMRNRVQLKINAIDREQLLEYYQKNLKDFNPPERVVWQNIFIKRDGYPSEAEARQKAETAYAKAKQVQTREEFATLAETYSDGPSKFRKGEGEGAERGQIRPPDLEELAFRLQPGEVAPLVELPQGFFIVRVEQHEPGGRIPFEKACPEIRKKLQQEIGQAEFAKILKELRGKAHIESAMKK